MCTSESSAPFLAGNFYQCCKDDWTVTNGNETVFASEGDQGKFVKRRRSTLKTTGNDGVDADFDKARAEPQALSGIKSVSEV